MGTGRLPNPSFMPDAGCKHAGTAAVCGQPPGYRGLTAVRRRRNDPYLQIDLSGSWGDARSPRAGARATCCSPASEQQRHAPQLVSQHCLGICCNRRWSLRDYISRTGFRCDGLKSGVSKVCHGPVGLGTDGQNRSASFQLRNWAGGQAGTGVSNGCKAVSLELVKVSIVLMP